MAEGSQRRPAVGSVVADRYRLEERLGGGGMGDVYRAVHELAGRSVALKLLRPDLAQDPEVARRFFQEAQAVNRIRHPNIVDVLDAGMAAEGPYVVMELLEGATAAAAVARLGRMDTLGALSVLLPMLDALDAAHGQGIVHRDLKPENVFLARTPASAPGGVVVKLVDFGIAKFLGAGGTRTSPQTHSGIIFGTPDYLSPEQASGDGVVDGRSDIFAAGIVLFELLTGRRPFEGRTAVATAYRIVHEPAPSLATFAVTADELLQDALDRALAKRAQDRFSSAAAFAMALRSLAGPEGIRRQALRQILDEIAPASPSVGSGARPTATTLRETEAPPALESAPVPALVRVRGVPAPPSSVRIPASKPSPASVPSPVSVPGASPQSSQPSPTSKAWKATVRSAGGSPTPVTPRWSPRALPPHVRGKCRCRGSLPRAVHKWVERVHGTDAAARVRSALPAEHAETYRLDGFNALLWYELEALDTFVDAATVLVLRGDAFAWREMARSHFETELGAVLRPPGRITDPLQILRRCPAAWARVLDFGAVRVLEPHDRRAHLRFEHFDATSLALRYILVGATEALLRGGGVPEVTVRIVAGETNFSRDFDFELAW